MDEPPVVSNLGDEAEAENPFRPTEITTIAPVVNALTPAYWVTVAVAFLVFGLLCYFAPGLGVPGIVAMVAAVIRVPIIRSRRLALNTSPANPISSLVVSWLLVVALGIASTVVFVIACIPIGFAGLALSNGSDSGLAMVFGLSALIAFAVFVFLYVMTLKMPQ